MNYENLLVSFENGILVLTINRPQALNALNKGVFNDLESVFTKDALTLEGLKGVIITGSGEKAFAAGADISEFTGIEDPSLGARLSQRGHDIFFAIERFHKPVIAAVNGFSLGGGCELAMACHLRIASEKARFGQPEVNLGLTPGYGGTQRLVQYIGKAKALELLLTADMIGAEEAHRLGLVNYVTPAGEEMTKAKELIEKISTKAPLAVAKVINCVNAFYLDGVDGFNTEVNEFASCTSTADFKEGALAFLEKRKANFTGV